MSRIVDVPNQKVAESRFSDLLESVAEAIVIVDQNGKIIQINRQLQQLFGYTSEELHGAELELLLPERFRAKHSAHLKYFFSHPKIRPMSAGHELYGLKKNGDEFPINVGLGFFRTKEGILASATIQDISERKRIEKSLRTKSQLFRLVSKTAEHANQATFLREAMRNCIDDVCAYTGWPVGHAYRRLPEDPNRLVSADIWHLADSEQFSTFREVTEATTFERGKGLPGRVWATGKPAWIVDVTRDPNFPRAKIAEDIGVRAGFALPVLTGSDVVAVLEFFAEEAIEPDEALLQMLTQIGLQLGQVADRVRAQKDLADREAELRAMLETSSVGVTVRDEHDKFSFVNSRALELTQLTEQQLLGTLWVKGFYDIEERQIVLDKIRRDEIVRSEEVRLKRADGSYFWALISINPVTYQGKKTYVSWITDISKRKAAEEALRQSEEVVRSNQRLLETILDNMPAHIFLRDLEGRYLLINAHYEKLYGVSRKDVIGKKLHEVLPQNMADIFSERDKDVIRERRAIESENHMPSEDSDRIFAAVKFPIFNSKNEITSIGGVALEITERLRAEEEHLRQARKMEVIGQLTGSVAHDFNNLLSAIGCNMALLKSQKNNHERQQSLIADCINAVEIGSNLTRRLTAFARKDPIATTSVDLNSLIVGFSDFLRRSIGQNVTIDFVLTDESLPVLVDTVLVEVALLNLVINARDAMSKGGMITVSSSKISIDEKFDPAFGNVEQEQYAMLQVSDTGIGMAPEIKEHMFEAFFTTKEKGKGTGLGLSTVKDLIQESGGFVLIDSELGKGTTVKVFLPLLRKKIP